MKKISRLLLITIMAAAFIFTGSKVIRYVNADDGQSVAVTDIDYDKMTLTISGNKDTAYYFSDSKQKSWERVSGETKDGKTTMDISWIPVTKDYVLSLKGNVSTKPITVKLPKYNSKFKVTYNKLKGTVSYSGVPSDFKGKIQWHASGFSNWNETPVTPNETETAAFAKSLAYYVNDMQTAKIYFRTESQKGSSVTSTGVRPSKVYVLSVPKKASAPTIKINGQSLCATIPAGVQYRVVGSGNGWSAVKTASSEIALNDSSANMPAGAFLSESNPNPKDQIVEFRAEANSKNQISSSAFVRINAQESKDAVGLGSVNHSFLSSSSVKVDFDVKAEMKDNKYEYAITKPAEGSTDAPNPDKDTKWSDLQVKSEKAESQTKYSVTKTFTSSTLKTNDKLWIRRKTTGTAGSDTYKIASQAYSLQIGSYPGASSSGDTAQAIKAVKNTCYTSDISLSYTVDANITEANTRISSVKIKDDSSSVVTLPEKLSDDVKYYEVQSPIEGSVVDGKRTYTLKITKDGITSLLANSKVETDKVYSFYVDLVSGESIKMNTTLEVLTGSSIVGDKGFTKIDGYDKSLFLTLNLGTKIAKDYDFKIVCRDGKGNDNEITNTKSSYVDASGNVVSDEKATYIKFEFSVNDDWLAVGAAREIKVNICKKDTGEVVETVTGATVELKMPVTIAQNGSITFSKGMRSNPVKFALNIVNDEKVINGFTITDIIWKNGSVEESLIGGAEIEQSGLSVSVTISKDTLNKLPVGSSNLYVKLGSGNIEYEISYVITVNASVSDTPTPTAAPTGTPSSGGTSASSLSLKGRSVASTRKGAESETAAATTSEKVEFAGIDYNANTLKIKLNGNDMAFYSTNKKTWYGVDGEKSSDGIVNMNINWISDTKNYTIYFKGTKSSSEENYVKVVIPAKNSKIKVKFDKTSPAEAPLLTLENRTENVTHIQWRKYLDTEWTTIPVSTKAGGDDSYIISDLEYLRVKGGKIVVRELSVPGTSTDNMGIRYSKEVTVSIPKRSNAPGIKINVAKLTINTSDSMEYYDTDSKKWTDCTKNMNIWKIPAVAKTVKATNEKAGEDVSVEFRKKATEKAGYSKICTVVFKGQAMKPTLGKETTDDITYGTEKKTVNKKEVTYQTITFNKASSTNKYQYAIVTSGSTFDESTAKWITVSKSTKITLSTSKAVAGTKIYVRTIGVNANTKLKTEAKLPSAVNSYTIS